MATIPIPKPVVNWTDINGERQSVRDDEGHLECSKCHGRAWCRHIEEAVSQGLDASMIWSEDDELPDFLWVPVVPSLHQWCSVSVDKFSDEAIRCSVELTRHKPGEERDFLGFINQGEGRQVLRQMILDYLRVQTDLHHHTCVSVKHGYKAEVQWKADLAKTWIEIEKVAQTWSVLNTGLCRSCSSTESDNWDDLIPDGSTKSRL